MRTWMFAISAGIGLAMMVPVLPDLTAAAYLAGALIPAFCIRYFPDGRLVLLPVSTVICGLLVGLLWGTGYAHWRLAQVLPSELEGQELWLEGEVVGLPKTAFKGRMIVRRFDLQLSDFELAKLPQVRAQPDNGESAFNNNLPQLLENISSSFHAQLSPQRVRLSWYGGPELAPGDKCRLKVKLKRPRSFANPGGFNYQVWLLQKGIDAQGYVRKDDNNSITESSAVFVTVDLLRYQLRERIKRMLANNIYQGVISALVIGDNTAITADQWQLFSATGTNHLVAISGLHIGLIAVMGYFFFFQLARTSTWLMMRLPAQNLGAIGAIVASLAYSALAGFSLSTSRACIMVTVLMGSRLLRRKWQASSVFLFALLAVLLMNPLSLHSYGFWLSFGAVAALLFVFSARFSSGGRVQRWLLPQWVVFVALAPAMLVIFNRLPWVSPLANMIAIPVYSFLVVPLSLLGAALSFISEGLAEPLLLVAAKSVALVSAVLQYLIDHLQFVDSLPVAYLSPLTLFALGLGTVLLLCPSFLPGRWLALILLSFPWLVNKPEIPEGQFEVNVLDVGQGLSVVINTRDHTMVYDTGAHYSNSFDLGKMVVQPFLQDQGGSHIDRLVISHNDNDHKGGMRSLVNNTIVKDLLAGELLQVDDHKVIPCKKDQSWDWDGVHFQVLHGGGAVKRKANNRSCVIQVRSAQFSLLLSGDIEKIVERHLLRDIGEDLQSTILVAPHHGSNTSSSQGFIEAVNPDYVVFSAGYRNRFNHPHPKVVARYKGLGVNMINTAFSGAVRFSQNSEDAALIAHSYRDENPHFWYAGDPFQLRLEKKGVLVEK